MPLALNSRYCGNVYIIQCNGRIVAGDEVRALEGALDLAAREFSRIVLHISEVDRLDSSGIGLLVRYASNMRKRGGDVRLAAPPQFIVSLLDLTRLSTILSSCPTEEDAILSFLRESAAQVALEKGGPRVLVLDPSADMCAFIRTILLQHRFDVKWTSRLSDAKTMLKVDTVDYILLGPDTSQFSSDMVLTSLKALAPGATTLQLGQDFKCSDALEASEALLQMLGANRPSA